MIAKFLDHKLRVWRVLALLTIFLATLTLSGFLGKLWWVFDMTSHFRVQYFATLTAFTLLFFLGKKFRRAAFAGTFALINLFLIVPPTIGSQIPASDGQQLRALTINLDITNSDFDKVNALIQQTQPDILLLTEYLPHWKRGLKETLSQYPHSIVSPLKIGWALGLYSRIPVEEMQIIHLGNIIIPIIEAKFNIGKKQLNFIGAHLQDPSSPTRLDVRNRQLLGLTRHLQKKSGPIIILGDLNVSPWSPYFVDLAQKIGLHGTEKNGVWLHTWPTFFFPLQIPLDYFLASKDIIIHQYQRGADIGSDHYPIMADFSIVPNHLNL